MIKSGDYVFVLASYLEDRIARKGILSLKRMIPLVHHVWQCKSIKPYKSLCLDTVRNDEIDLPEWHLPSRYCSNTRFEPTLNEKNILKEAISLVKKYDSDYEPPT